MPQTMARSRVRSAWEVTWRGNLESLDNQNLGLIEDLQVCAGRLNGQPKAECLN